jgi:molybdopterin/thiamine biosynthesis adenylyltransferase
MKCIVIGLGGVGSALVYPLARYLNFLASEDEDGELSPHIVLIDGDEYEAKNMDRQVLTRKGLEQNKAEYHAYRLGKIFEFIEASSVGEFVNRENIADFIEEGAIVFGCVDNHATRKLLQEHCLKLENVLYVSGGNEMHDGNVQVFSRKGGKNETVPIWTAHEEIRYPQDKSPEDMSCEELMNVEPQLIFTNFMVAALMLNAFYIFQNEGVPTYSEVYFDILANKTRPVLRK